MTIRLARITGPVQYVAGSGRVRSLPIGPCLIESAGGTSVDIIWGARGERCIAHSSVASSTLGRYAIAQKARAWPTTLSRMPNANTYGHLVLQLRKAPALAAAQAREIYGLMAILIAHDSRERWTRDERVAVSRRLRALVRAVSYVLLFVLPGSILSLPLLAWWLRRQNTQPEAEQAASPIEE